MTEERNKWIDAVIKLLELTQEGNLHWDLYGVGIQPLFEENEGVALSAIFTTSYNGKNLRLYKERYKRPKRQTISESVTAIGLSLAGGEPPPTPMLWDSRIRLEFVTEEGASLWSFPDMAPLEDLLETVQYQVAGVKDFLDDLLSEDQSGKAAIGFAEGNPTK